MPFGFDRNRTGSPLERHCTPWWTEGRKPDPQTDLPAEGVLPPGYQHDEAGKVFVFGSQAVGDPRTGGGKAEVLRAGVQDELGGRVIELVGLHRADHAGLVGDAGEVGHEIRNPVAAARRPAGNLAWGPSIFGVPWMKANCLPSMNDWGQSLPSCLASSGL